jgi:hypothetical protein
VASGILMPGRMGSRSARLGRELAHPVQVGWSTEACGSARLALSDLVQSFVAFGQNDPVQGLGSVGSMLLAEDLLLLVTDDGSGRLSAPAAQVDVALGGANLVELKLMGKVDLSGAWDRGKAGRIIVRDPSPTGDEVLDAALGIISAHQGKKPSTVVQPLGKNLRRTLYERLVLGGVVRAEQSRVFGVFRAQRWPAQDASHEAQVRRLMTQVLVQRAAPEPRSAVLIALVHALRYEHKIVVPRECGLSRQQLRARAEEIAEGTWAAEAIRQAIGQMIAAVVAATSAAAAAGSVAPG